jgi:hypothetical protein
MVRHLEGAPLLVFVFCHIRLIDLPIRVAIDMIEEMYMATMSKRDMISAM